MTMLTILAQAVWFILPALAPSSGAVLVGGGPAIDGGRKDRKGRRILGDGKTWRGLVGGTFVGMALGAVLNTIAILLNAPDWQFAADWPETLLILFLLSFGSMMGDIGGSWLKRRLGMGKGAKFPVMDQYDLLIGALFLLALFRWEWFFQRYINDDYIYGFIFILVLIPMLHRMTNIAGYRMGKKEVPW